MYIEFIDNSFLLINLCVSVCVCVCVCSIVI